ncbi:MAG: deoxyuridine 5'-triphosphate nucleotidohydrolase [Weeksellaceae bacterium]|nr:deoxyuridine 5'-triphosphate nucleotidohydrolase [Weeksellaceae bacterium]
MEYSKEFKQALSAFSPAEKDRLIFRLLKKDKILSQKLYFELIDPENEDEKRAKMEIFIEAEVAAAAKHLRNPKYFLVLIRKISARITEHVKITSDKFGEVSLNILLVNEVLNHSKNLSDTYKLYMYLLNKIFRIVVLTEKLHPDYFLELKSGFERLADLINSNHQLKKLFVEHGFNLAWLDPDHIPAEISSIQKELKNKGFLR